MWAGLGPTLPMAMGLALSPVAATTALVLLPAPRGRIKTLLFLAGWYAVLFAVMALAMVFTDAADEDDPTGTAEGIDILHLVFGILFFLLAIAAWIKRPARDREDGVPLEGEEAKPGMMARLDGLGIWACFGVGVAEAVLIIKNIPLGVSAGATLGRADLSTAGGLGTVAILTAVASLSILIPLVAVLIGGSRATGSLRQARAWIEAHMTAITLVVLIVFGTIFLGEGLNLAG